MKGGRLNNFTGGIFAGCLLALLTCLLMGATGNSGPILAVPAHELAVDRPLSPRPLPLHGGAAGRYQLATWQSGGSYGAFVIDTVNGTTKIAYRSAGPNSKQINNLGKPFQQM
ncbi:hypothetical protein [Desulfobulbus oligotrophicus]|uniref:Uncharacterized protein n=1 Tax=Desulfobulbus oligotrophicus TaxID=1909699 RepID=A0A7T5VC79_9BACT|nr:hypothetical protein [Desulfobulbus oligotrophicus]QQG65124.1 hypothetical protein HP555_04195 [Desulfobulbus oligotrophicus]